MSSSSSISSSSSLSSSSPDDLIDENILQTNIELFNRIQKLNNDNRGQNQCPPPYVPNAATLHRAARAAALNSAASSTASAAAAPPPLSTLLPVGDYIITPPNFEPDSASGSGSASAAASTSSTSSTSSSASFYLSAHGNDLEIHSRLTIVDTIISGTFEIPSIVDGSIDNISYWSILKTAFPIKKKFIKAFSDYITNNIIIQVSMGAPGPSAPMDTGSDKNIGTKLEYFSSSEVELFIVGECFKALYDSTLPSSALSKPPPTSSAKTKKALLAELESAINNPVVDISSVSISNCKLYKVNNIIRHQLRTMFYRIWDLFLNKKGPDGLPLRITHRGANEWQKHYQKFIVAKNIWRLKSLSSSSFDRYFQLAANAGEDAALRVHEGIHINDIRDENGVEETYEPIPGSGTRSTLVNFKDWRRGPVIFPKKGGVEPVPNTNNLLDVNNLCIPAFRERFKLYVESKLFNLQTNTKEQAIYRAILGILHSIELTTIYLSEICLLGFLLKISMFTIWDPACRPITDDTLGKFNKKGVLIEYSDEIYGTTDFTYTSYVLSQPISVP
jgi:hypothetical protein